MQTFSVHPLRATIMGWQRAGNSVVGPALLIGGGIAYTAGTLFFANEPLLYGHCVWHQFVLAGTSCHFAVVLFAQPAKQRVQLDNLARAAD